MPQILDEHMAQAERNELLCKKLRFYTLLFTGLMACLYLVFNLLHWLGGKYFLIIGLAAISLQSILCFVTMKKKTWTAGLRALITLLATLYIIDVLTGIQLF